MRPRTQLRLLRLLCQASQVHNRKHICRIKSSISVMFVQNLSSHKNPLKHIICMNTVMKNLFSVTSLKNISQHQASLKYTCVHAQERGHISLRHVQKRFVGKGHLTEHLRKHTKPYKCESCAKSFAAAKQLTRHMNTHTKPHHCEVCSERFSHLSALTRHMEQHIGKPYQCELCAKRFSSSNYLAKHACNTAGESTEKTLSM